MASQIPLKTMDTSGHEVIEVLDDNYSSTPKYIFKVQLKFFRKSNRNQSYRQGNSKVNCCKKSLKTGWMTFLDVGLPFIDEGTDIYSAMKYFM